MSLVVLFDEGATPEKVLEVIFSAHTPDFSSRTDALIDPDISALEGTVPRKYWKRVLSTVVEFTAAEKTQQDTDDAAATDSLIRQDAKNGLIGFGPTGLGPNPLLLRAFADIVKDEINVLRGWLDQFKADVAAATNLADLKTSVAAQPSLPDRTLAQLRTAIDNKIDGGTVDS